MSRRHHVRSVAAAALLLLSLRVTAQARRVDIVETRPVPVAISTPRDVRWTSATSVMLSAGLGGVAEWDWHVNRISTVIQGKAVLSHASGQVPSFFASEYLAITKDRVVIGAPFYAMAWKRQGDTQLSQRAFASIVDLDAQGDHAVVLGVPGDARGHWQKTGPALWSVSLENGGDPEPIEPAPPASLYRDCHLLGAGAVRYFPDGRFAVASSLTPGVMLFDAQRRLIRTWRTEGLGYADHCSVTPEQADASGSDASTQSRLMNARELLDDMLPTADGVLLLLRSASAHATRWRGVLLPFRGEPIRIDLPLMDQSIHARLKADVRGDLIVFLISDHPLPGATPAQPRLVIARIH